MSVIQKDKIIVITDDVVSYVADAYFKIIGFPDDENQEIIDETMEKITDVIAGLTPKQREEIKFHINISNMMIFAQVIQNLNDMYFDVYNDFVWGGL